MSFSFANQPIQQKNTNDHVTSASEESSYKEGQDIEKKRNSMKNVCYLDDSSDDYPGENNRANPSSESYEFEENCNPIPNEYVNLDDEESSNYDPELNEESYEPNIDRDKKFPSKLLGGEIFLKTIEQESDLKIGKSKKANNALGNGKQYGEEWKRNFVINLLKILSQLDEAKRNDYIKQVAHKIKVMNYEIKIWLSSYQIIFKIEKKINKETSSKELINLIERELFIYVKNNGDSRRYIVTKMLAKIVKSLKIKKPQIKCWVNKFVNKYKSEFKGFEILNSKNENSEDDQVNDDKGKDKQTKMLQKKKRKRQEKRLNLEEKAKRSSDCVLLERSSEVDIENYSISFREKISNKISEEMNRVFEEVLKQKSEEFCLSYGIIKSIFKQHGHISLEGKERTNLFTSKTTNSVEKSIDAGQEKYMETSTAPLTKMGEPNKMFSNEDNKKIQPIQNACVNDFNQTQEPLSDEALLEKLEEKVSNFIKLNLNCPARALEKSTESAMATLNFNNELKSKVRDRWLCQLLKKNNLTIDSNRYLREIEKDWQYSKRKAKTRHISLIKKEEIRMKEE